MSPKLNTVEELSKGIVKTPDNTLSEYTILLVGETGTGKTSLLSLLSNVLAGRNPDKYVFSHDQSNEAGGSEKYSQTKLAQLYEFKSNNGIKFRILDTPGLADTRGIDQDEKHKANIIEAVTSIVTTVHAVVIVANGTLPRLGVSTDYALWSLSAMFPRTLDKSIAIFLTNVPNSLGCNFTQDSLPPALRGENYHPHWIDNPVALWKNYNKIKEGEDDDVDEEEMEDMKKDVRQCHKKALKELLKFFNWLVGLKPQPTNDIQTLYNKSQQIERSIADALSRATQLEDKKQELLELAKNPTTLDDEKFERAITKKVWGHSPTEYHNTLCEGTGCYSNCHIHCYLDFSLNPQDFMHCMAMGNDNQCNKCGHSYLDHRHYNALWKQEESTEIIVDEKKRFDARKSGAGRQKEMKAGLERAIARLDDDLKKSLDEVALHSAAYSKLSLTGSFTALIQRTVRLLETTAEAMRNNNSDTDSIKVVEKSLEVVKKKLELVTNVVKSA